MGARGSDASDRSRSRSRSRCLLPPLRRKFPRPFAGEFSGGLQEHLAAPCQLHRSGVAAGRGSRAGLTGWYSGREKNPGDKAKSCQDRERGA
jgi:hypothetical protein